MKKMLLALFVLFIFSTTYAKSDETENYFTQESINGRMWIELTEYDKSLLINGIWEGIAMFGSYKPEIADNIEGTELLHGMLYALHKTFTPKLVVIEFISRIDKFYIDEFNRNIPIREVYHMICDEYSSTVSEYKYNEEERLRELRKKYNK